MIISQNQCGSSFGRFYHDFCFLDGSDSKESAYNAGDPELGRFPGEGNGNPVFLPGEFYGQRNLAGYHPQGLKESDTTELTNARVNMILISFQQCHI